MGFYNSSVQVNVHIFNMFLTASKEFRTLAVIMHKQVILNKNNQYSKSNPIKINSKLGAARELQTNI